MVLLLPKPMSLGFQSCGHLIFLLGVLITVSCRSEPSTEALNLGIRLYFGRVGHCVQKSGLLWVSLKGRVWPFVLNLTERTSAL